MMTTMFQSLLGLGLALCLGCKTSEGPAAQPAALRVGQSITKTSADMSYPPEIEALLAQMTLEEKVGQMTQITIDVVADGEPYNLKFPLRIVPEKLSRAIETYGVGSILNTGAEARTQDEWYAVMAAIQEATQRTRLKIPVLYGIDAIHGPNYTVGATLFPQQLGLAASWDLGLAEEMAAMSAYETRASATPWTFSPVLDLGRNPIWPRLWEGFGEDVLLSTEMGMAMTRGYQGDSAADKYRVAACLKHFTGYGASISGKDRTPAYVAERQMQEYYIPAFAKAIEAGALTIMINSSELNGLPVHIDHHLLTTVLRDQLGFKGLAVSDWEDIKYLHSRHRVAATEREAVKMAVLAGVDMSMVPTDFSFADHLIDLVKSGEVPMSRIDEAVRRILWVKKETGLFEQLYYPKSDYPLFGSAEHAAKARRAAQESIILLKNSDNLLPLGKNQRVLVTGPTAKSMRSLNGGWSYTWQGERSDEFAADKHDIAEAITAVLGEDKVSYVQGADFDSLTNWHVAVEAARTADVIVLCLGEASYTEYMGSANDLYLPDAQKELALALAATGKPIVLLLAEGRPRLISKFEADMDAILLGFYPGNEGGDAFADVLFGEVNPSAKLPVTYPSTPNGLINYDHKHTDNPGYVTPLGAMYAPQFEFGHGLSYTSFAYSDLQVSTARLSAKGSISVSVTVRNTGQRAGKEVVQLYVSDHYASITPPVKRLRAFRKIELAPGASQRVSFELRPEDLAFVGQDLKWITEPGSFTASIGGLQADFEYVD